MLLIFMSKTELYSSVSRYGVASGRGDRSGAYLFLPDGDATAVKIENTIVNVIEGPILSSVTVQLPYVLHKAVLYNTPGNWFIFYEFDWVE